MIKGKWVIIAVVTVAVLMGLASWPLMRIRRNSEIHKTEALLASLLGSCEHYRIRHGEYPPTLRILLPQVDREVVDPWGRPIRYEIDARSGKPRLQSLGPRSDDSSDDIFSR